MRKMRFSLRRADPIFAYKDMPLYAKIGYRSNEKKSFDSLIRTCPYMRVKGTSTHFSLIRACPYMRVIAVIVGRREAENIISVKS